MPKREHEEDDDVLVDVGGQELAAAVQRQDLGGPVELDDRAARVETQRILAAKLRLESDQVNLQKKSGLAINSAPDRFSSKPDFLRWPEVQPDLC